MSPVLSLNSFWFLDHRYLYRAACYSCQFQTLNLPYIFMLCQRNEKLLSFLLYFGQYELGIFLLNQEMRY